MYGALTVAKDCNRQTVTDLVLLELIEDFVVNLNFSDDSKSVRILEEYI